MSKYFFKRIIYAYIASLILGIVSVALYAHNIEFVLKEIKDSILYVILVSAIITFVVYLIGILLLKSSKMYNGWIRYIKYQYCLFIFGIALLFFSMIPGIAVACKCGHYFPNPYPWGIGGLLCLLTIMYHGFGRNRFRNEEKEVYR